VADHKVSRAAIEDSDFVFAQNHRLAALMIENHHVIGYFLLVVDDYLIAALTEGLDDFGGLRTRTVAGGRPESIGRTSARAIDLPGLTVGNEYSSRRYRAACCSALVSAAKS
jgi:hypothetical protein